MMDSNELNEGCGPFKATISSLTHSIQCKNCRCRKHACAESKDMIWHSKICKKIRSADCLTCDNLISIVSNHAKRCRKRLCNIPFCRNIRQKKLLSKKAEVTPKARSGPRLRRSIVMECFSQFIFNAITAPTGKLSQNKNLACQFGGLNIWKAFFVNSSFPYYFQKCILKANYPMFNQLICNKDRYIVKNFYGFGARLSPKVINMLIEAGRVPLFDKVVAKSSDDANLSRIIPTRSLYITTMTMSKNQKLDFDFRNIYLRSLYLTFSADCIEHNLEFLSKLKDLYPNLTDVDITYYYGEPISTSLASNQLEPKLKQFATDIKLKNVGVDKFCEVLNEYIFKTHPNVTFVVSLQYPPRTKLAEEIRQKRLPAVSRGERFLFKDEKNQIKAIEKDYNITSVSFKLDYSSLL